MIGVVQQNFDAVPKNTTAAAAGSTIANATVKDMPLGIELGCKERTGSASMQTCQAKGLRRLITA